MKNNGVIMRYSDLVNAFYGLQTKVLGEEECRTLYLYLNRKRYRVRKGIKNISENITRIEFDKATGEYAFIDIDEIGNEVCLYEYSANKEMESVINFSSLERLDIIRNTKGNSYVHSINNFAHTLYYNEDAASDISFKYFHASEVSKDVKPSDVRSNEDRDFLFRLFDIENYVQDIKSSFKKGQLELVR